MPQMIFVNLPVADVDKSVAFYEAIGATRDERFSQPGQGEMMVWSDAISFMLLSHDFFRGFLPAGKAIADARSTTEVLLALSCDSRKAVDAITEAAAEAGGRADPRPAQDMGWMYGRSFEDLDGHIFEPSYMDLDAAMQAMASRTEAA
jgi:hypothetical protein